MAYLESKTPHHAIFYAFRPPKTPPPGMPNTDASTQRAITARTNAPNSKSNGEKILRSSLIDSRKRNRRWLPWELV